MRRLHLFPALLFFDGFSPVLARPKGMGSLYLAASQEETAFTLACELYTKFSQHHVNAAWHFSGVIRRANR